MLAFEKMIPRKAAVVVFQIFRRKPGVDGGSSCCAFLYDGRGTRKNE